MFLIFSYGKFDELRLSIDTLIFYFQEYFMAELNMLSHAHGKKGKLRRCKKLSTKVDLTAMVDLGFLLITFFILTTSWTKPTVMKIFLPADGPGMPVPESTSLTIIPLRDEKIFYYHGSLQSAISMNQYGVCDYSFKTGIGNIIRQTKFLLNKNKSFSRIAKDLVIMIKPATQSNFQNIVKVLDEMLINKVSRYAITDLDMEEKQLLEEKKLLN
jgi:biopolymer transport protein ExbD